MSTSSTIRTSQNPAPAGRASDASGPATVGAVPPWRIRSASGACSSTVDCVQTPRDCDVVTETDANERPACSTWVEDLQRLGERAAPGEHAVEGEHLLVGNRAGGGQQRLRQQLAPEHDLVTLVEVLGDEGPVPLRLRLEHGDHVCDVGHRRTVLKPGLELAQPPVDPPLVERLLARVDVVVGGAQVDRGRHLRQRHPPPCLVGHPDGAHRALDREHRR